MSSPKASAKSAAKQATRRQPVAPRPSARQEEHDRRERVPRIVAAAVEIEEAARTLHTERGVKSLDHARQLACTAAIVDAVRAGLDGIENELSSRAFAKALESAVGGKP